jgi:pyruvate/2-oxoglutarate dehydrogenase complex dihydrolipoamide acyltransferase (E2) component
MSGASQPPEGIDVRDLLLACHVRIRSDLALLTGWNNDARKDRERVLARIVEALGYDPTGAAPQAQAPTPRVAAAPPTPEGIDALRDEVERLNRERSQDRESYNRHVGEAMRRIADLERALIRAHTALLALQPPTFAASVSEVQPSAAVAASAPEGKDCPFCGHEPAIEHLRSSTPVYPIAMRIACSDCGARAAVAMGNDHDAVLLKAWSMWDRRPAPEVQP